MPVMSRCCQRLALGLILALLAASPAAAELVILTNGHFFKVTAFERQGERMRLTLPSGGRVTLGLERIERILDDEVVDEPEPPQEPPRFSWRFEEGHGVPIVPYGELIFEIASRHHLNPELVAAVVRAESAFDRWAVSNKGAHGLMQLMPATAQRFGVTADELFEPARNLDGGAAYLAWLLARFDGDLSRALAAYNAGEGTVERYGGVPPYRETRRYLARIFSSLGIDGDGVATTAGAR